MKNLYNFIGLFTIYSKREHLQYDRALNEKNTVCVTQI